AEDMPGFKPGAQFDMNIALREIADARETKFEVWREPVELEWVPGVAQVVNHILEIRLAKMRQHPAVVNVCSPSHEIVRVGMLPEFRDQPAQQKMLGQAHARVRR